ncbi:hypothetical protein HanIR_Chr04g0151771 [Helianthus annuus]|nr:hypothetical protein HanIR_Chr04g0151771 [Helianthus annuus]
MLQHWWPRSRMSWRQRFISSKSSFNSRSEDDSTVFSRFAYPFFYRAVGPTLLQVPRQSPLPHLDRHCRHPMSVFQGQRRMIFLTV